MIKHIAAIFLALLFAITLTTCGGEGGSGGSSGGSGGSGGGNSGSSSGGGTEGGGDSGGSSGGGAEVTVPQAPTLKKVTCSSGGGCPCNLVGTWDSVNGATSYNIYYRTYYGSVPSSNTVKNYGTKIAGVSSGVSYNNFDPSYHTNCFIVTAVNSTGESEASNVICATC